MTESESLQVFLRFLDQRYSEFKLQLEIVLETMTSNDQESKLSNARQLLSSGSALALTLAASDRPSWLREIIDNTEWYVGNYGNNSANHAYLMKILGNFDTALNHEWLFTQTETAQSYNHDNLYQNLNGESRIVELFDQMAETLNQMIDSCEIDSVSAINSLDQLILLIKQNRQSSFFSVTATQDFITRFIKNATWMHIRKIPGVKTLKDNFEKTIKDMDTEIDRVQKEISNAIQQRYDNSVKPIMNRNPVKKVQAEPETIEQ
ncbi:MAG: hypothetical protein OEZ43_02345 [Gammaproteobacteria bacterium]|nr:hypothetical protein [Gammaproteobacteria bacterium]